MAISDDTLTPRGLNILRSLRANFAALDDHARIAPGEVDDLVAAIAAHVRSWRPLAIASDAAPAFAIRAEPPTPAAEIQRSFGDDCKYVLSRVALAGESLVSFLVRDADDTAALVLDRDQARVLVEDLHQLLAAIGGPRG